MLAIKLQRIGKKHQPGYRVVVAEARSKMDASPVEDLGFYDPSSKAVGVKKDRILHWISVGAQPTVTAHNLLAKQGIISAVPQTVHMKTVKTASRKERKHLRHKARTKAK